MNQPGSGGSKADIEVLTGVTLPADTKILYAGGSGRQGEAYHQFVLQSASPFDLHKGSEATVPAESVFATIATAVATDKIGTPTTTDAAISDWIAGQKEWRASIVKTTAGWVLHLEELSGK